MMFPPTNPTAERIRHQVEIDEWVNRHSRDSGIWFRVSQLFSRILTARRQRPQIALPPVRSTQEMKAY
jgi:hypothetical protein